MCSSGCCRWILARPHRIWVVSMALAYRVSETHLALVEKPPSAVAAGSQADTGATAWCTDLNTRRFSRGARMLVMQGPVFAG